MSRPLTPDEALAVLAKVPADSPTGRCLREAMVDAQRLRLYVRDLKRRIRLARKLVADRELTLRGLRLHDLRALLDLRRSPPKVAPKRRGRKT